MSKRWTVSRFPASLEGFNGSTLTSQNVETLATFDHEFLVVEKKEIPKCFLVLFQKFPGKNHRKIHFCYITNAWEFRESSELQPTNQLATPICSPHPNNNWFFLKKTPPKFLQHEEAQTKQLEDLVSCNGGPQQKETQQKTWDFYTLRYLPGTWATRIFIPSDFHTHSRP